MATDQPVVALDGDFRAAMRQLAATVSLVVTCDDGAWHGMPATAVSSLSTDPPSLLVCINRSASMHGPTSRSRRFGVVLLADHQAELCGEFGGRASAERFGAGEWQSGPGGLPYLDDAAAVLFCEAEQEVHYGTHTIFVGRVTETRVAPDRKPLVFQEGRMGRFAPFIEDQAQ